MSGVLDREQRGPVAVLRIDRPDAYNALNREVLDSLRAALDEYRNDESVRALVLTGSTKAFCAGADITAFDALRAEALIGPRSAAGGSVWADLGSYPKPVIAAVDGVAFGGGCELALACDIVVAGDGASFAVPEVTLGVIPGGGGTQRLIRAIGKAKAMALLLTGDRMSAADADAAGLVSCVVPAGEALESAVAMARRIAANSPVAVALAKDAALASTEVGLAAGLEHEKRNFHIALRTDDCHEGQQAFLDKRSPVFNGK